jgi:predicted AAA+ superfamily ATPase
VNAERIAANRALFGPLLEAFAFSEVMKQEGWLDENCALSHYRDKDKDEVDVVIENELGEIVGIEVKASATVGSGDFRGLKKLADATGRDFKLGVVIYDGEQSLPFGERLYAAPVSCLWGV